MNRLALYSAIVAFIAPVQGQIGGKAAATPQGYCYGMACNAASTMLDEGFGSRVVKASPFSATEERHSLQVLGDGTRIENGQTNRLYRDTEGRTRVEEMNGTITIYDPVANLRVELDPATKTAHKTNTVLSYNANKGTVEVFANSWGSRILIGNNPPPNPATLAGVMSETTENLPLQSINGAMAQGVRTTMTIPKGQVGNNRDIKVMTERWFSKDL